MAVNLLKLNGDKTVLVVKGHPIRLAKIHHLGCRKALITRYLVLEGWGVLPQLCVVQTV